MRVTLLALAPLAKYEDSLPHEFARLLQASGLTRRAFQLEPMRMRPPRDQSSIVIVLQGWALVWAVSFAAASALLLWVADTWLGRAAALLGLQAAVLPWIGITAWIRRTRFWKRAALAIVGAAAVLLALLLVNARIAQPGFVNERVMNQFTRQPGVWLHWAPTNLVPESDQLLFSYQVMAMLDPLLTFGDAGRLGRLTAALYREQTGNAGFSELGSVMPEAYAELFGFPEDSGHSYVYVPHQLDRSKAAAVLIFFHGSGGNFKAYLWELSALADRLGFILVAPTSGFGQWHPGQAEAALKAALAAARRVALVDPRHIHLVGLSNGGRAVSQLGAAKGISFKTLAFISPVFDSDAIDSSEFALQAAGRPMLVVTGARDDRTPIDYVERNVRELKRTGATVKLATFADADHFLMFSHRDQLIDAMTVWFGEINSANRN